MSNRRGRLHSNSQVQLFRVAVKGESDSVQAHERAVADAGRDDGGARRLEGEVHRRLPDPALNHRDRIAGDDALAAAGACRLSTKRQPLEGQPSV